MASCLWSNDGCCIPLLRGVNDIKCVRGRATRGTVVREFDRRHRSSIPRDLQDGDPPRWEQLLDAARERLVRRGVVFGDPDLWELP